MGGERGGPKGCESNSAVARLLREAGAVAEGTGRDSQTCVAGELTEYRVTMERDRLTSQAKRATWMSLRKVPEETASGDPECGKEAVCL